MVQSSLAWPLPQTFKHHGGHERHPGNQPIIVADRLLRADTDHVSATDRGNAGAHKEDDQTADLGRQQRPDAVQDRRQQGLDDAREHGHAEDQREAAEFQGGNRGLEKDRVVARRTQKSAANPTSRQRLQDGGHAERYQRQAEHVDRSLGGQFGQLDDERGKDELDAHQADVLEAAEQSQERRRHVVDAVGQLSGLLRLRGRPCASPRLEPLARMQRAADDSS